MSEISKNDFKENNTELKTINNYNSIKNSILLPNVGKNFIKAKAIKILREIDKKKENNSIFLTEENNSQREFKKIRNRKRKNNSLIRSYNTKGIKAIESFNVFGNEDEFIKDLMEQFNKKNKQKISKIEKRRIVLDKLYGIDPQYNKNMKIAKRNKKVTLEEYQAKTFKILSKNDIGKTELNDLAYNLKNLRLQSDSVSPLPPINLNIIYDHVYRSNSNRNKKINKMTIKQLIKESNEHKDEFEKEEKLIKQMMSYKPIQRGKRNKAFDILPDYLKDALSKRFNK